MKKILLLVMLLGMSLALPAIASPPQVPPDIEAVGLMPGLPAVFALQAPAIAAAPRLKVRSPPGEALAASALILGVYCIATLAGLMRCGMSAGNRLSSTSYDARDRLHAMARDQTAAA